MIEFNETLCLDLKDDFEELGKYGDDFSLNDLIKYDLSKAFAFGYSHRDWFEEGMWFPTSIRKEFRHLRDGLEDYYPQKKWLDEKYGEVDDIEDYANYILDNVFYDRKEDLIKIAILLGTLIKNNERARNIY